jgi:hypothetical protein
MRFFVNSITAHTAKCNIISYNIIDTNTILDGCEVTGYAPKSVELVPGINQEIPFFVVNGIFGFNRAKNVKSLERQLQAKAPKGQKRVWRAQANDLFTEISKLNIEVKEPEKDPVGSFIGEVGDKITIMVKSIELVHSHDWCSQWGWRHNGHGWERPHGTKCMWRITDGDDNIFMFSSSGEVTNGKLSDKSEEINNIIEATVDAHSVFRGVKQTWIRNIKFNPGLFGLLS